MKVVSFGEILWDIIEGKAYLGGAPLNFAAHATQCGADSLMISRLGSDDYGKQALQKLAEVDVGYSEVQIDKKHPTGSVDVFLENGQPSYIIHPGVAYDYISFEELNQSFLSSDFGVFYYGTLAQRNKTSRETLYNILESKTFDQIFYDVNLRKDCYSKDIVLQSLEKSNILKLNDEEVSVLSEYMFSKNFGMEDFAKGCYDKYGHEVIIITAGAQGCYVYHREKMQMVSGQKVTVADTVGAGDSFSASFMYMYYQTGDPIKAASIGNQIGAFVASQRGAIPAYTEEIRMMLSNS